MTILKIFDYFYVLRPMLLIPVWTIMILGFYSHGNSSGNAGHLVLSLLVGTCLFGAVFLINQIFDIESDRINDKLYFLPRGHIKVWVAWLMTAILDTVSLILAFFISFPVLIASALVIILGILYSTPPIALKNRGWLAALANGLGHGVLVFIIGFCAAGGFWLSGLLKSLPYFWAVMGVYIGTTLPDIEGDSKTGKVTIGVAFGRRIANIIALICYALALTFGLIVHDVSFLIAALAALPFYIWSIYSPESKTIALVIKIPIISLSLAAAYFAPLYILFLILLVSVTRAYYKARFGKEYPSLR